MLMDDSLAVTQCSGDECWRQFGDEAFEGGVSGAAKVDADCSSLDHEGVCLNVLAGEGAGEQPLTVLVSRLLVGPVIEVVPEQRRD